MTHQAKIQRLMHDGYIRALLLIRS